MGGIARMRVLVATDGGEPAAEAERLLTTVADRSATEMVAVCVNTFDMSLHVSEIQHLGRYSPEAGDRYAERLAKAAAARIEAAGFRSRWRADAGDAASQLLELARSEAAGLVVAGHSRWRESPMLGRTSRILLHESPCSVLLVRRFHVWGPDRRSGVLVATDGSEGAEHAVRTFASFADPNRCQVLVASVMRGAAPAMPGDTGRTGTGEPEMPAEESVAAAVRVLEERGFACKTEVVHGHPARALLEVAEREGSSVVVAGSRGRGLLKRLTLGSVSDAVARHADAAFIGRVPPHADPSLEG